MHIPGRGFLGFAGIPRLKKILNLNYGKWTLFRIE
jgi:hypothetical protein